MSKSIRLPIRFKILVTLLSIISVVVGVITFTMAQAFHQDKTSYIHDLTSVIALHTAEETRSLFEGYRGRMRMYLLILEDRRMTEEQKAEKIEAFVRLMQPLGLTEISRTGVVAMSRGKHSM